MAARSSITRNPQLQAAVEKLIAEGFTVDEVHDAVADFGVSRSAVGRYAKHYRPMVEAIIQEKAVYEALRKHLPDGVDTGLLDVAFHRSQAELVRTLQALGEAEDAASTKDLSAATRTLRNIVNGMRDRKAYEVEVAEAERRKNAEAAVAAAHEIGATEQQADFIKRKILGMKP